VAGRFLPDFEHGLNVAVKKLRAALNYSVEAPRYIETFARRGYPFIAPLQGLGQARAAPEAAPGAEADKRTGDPLVVGAALYHWRRSRSLVVAGALLLTLGIVVTASLGKLRAFKRYEEALEQFRRTIEPDPTSRAAYSWAGLALELQGRGAEAVAAYIKADSLAGSSAVQIKSLESAARTGGVRGYWRKRLEVLQERAKRERVPPYNFASVYVHIGENGRAMDLLEAAYRRHAPHLA
jgi:tetratricopeptide (TPR) repeat protein